MHLMFEEWKKTDKSLTFLSHLSKLYLLHDSNARVSLSEDEDDKKRYAPYGGLISFRNVLD